MDRQTLRKRPRSEVKHSLDLILILSECTRNSGHLRRPPVHVWSAALWTQRSNVVLTSTTYSISPQGSECQIGARRCERLGFTRR